ncbi:MAG TPA: exosome complex protein Rrp42 [Candidatus Nanoarchaeia archaeon]|nr:exosome complex protein Rrp42 [Candidatus Nanoarchaeia archaeon]
MTGMETPNINVETYKRMFAEGKRFDGRKLLDSRKIDVSFDVSNKAEGSARVKIGKTEVVAGIKLQVGAPYPDSLDKGNLMVSGDLLPLASPRYEVGPPKFTAIELPRLVDRAVRESHMIDLKKLVIKEGEKVWTVIIDVYPINDDGNLLEAASIAAVAALKKTMIPAIDENGKIDYHAPSKTPLPLAEGVEPISISIFKLGDHLILDPTREEEEACDVRVTFGVAKHSGKHYIHSAQKSGETVFTRKELESIMEILPKKFDELSEKLKKLL